MNPEKIFHGVVMERVQEGKEAEAEAVMTEAFEKQGEGFLSSVGSIAGVVPKLISLIKPECIEEVKQAAAQAGSSLLGGFKLGK